MGNVSTIIGQLRKETRRTSWIDLPSTSPLAHPIESFGSLVLLFFMSCEGWEGDWTFREVLGLMGDALHDTVKSPEIANNFDCCLNNSSNV
jgi:hypothetical protein